MRHLFIILSVLLFCFTFISCGEKEESSSSSTTTINSGLYVAVGSSGTILTSSDGTTWTSRTSDTSKILNGVSKVNSNFVTVGETGTILSSSDGTSWTSGTSPLHQKTLLGVTYNE